MNISAPPCAPYEEAFRAACLEAGPRGLLKAVRGMILSGHLSAGQRLPTVRSTAALLGLSPGTVAGVWGALRDEGLIETRRRGGTIVCALPTGSPGASRILDLAQGGPDPRLQPHLGEALRAGLDLLDADDEAAPIAPGLLATLRPTWPCAPEAWTTVGGGTEGITLALEAAARGGSIAVEDPTSPRLVEAVRRLGLLAHPVPWTPAGPDPAALEAALAAGAAAFVYQPRAHLPLGRHVAAEGLRALAAVLARHPGAALVEDDCLGPLAEVPLLGLSGRFPDRSVLVRTYCRAFGAQLKVCVLGGSRALIGRVPHLRSHGSGRTSRILEGALAHQLGSRTVQAELREARRRYAARRRAMAQALAARGVALDGQDGGEGPFLWIEVANTAQALVGLSALGIQAAPGVVCRALPSRDQHLCLGVTTLPDEPAALDAVASRIARVIDHDAAPIVWI